MALLNLYFRNLSSANSAGVEDANYVWYEYLPTRYVRTLELAYILYFIKPLRKTVEGWLATDVVH